MGEWIRALPNNQAHLPQGNERLQQAPETIRLDKGNNHAPLAVNVQCQVRGFLVVFIIINEQLLLIVCRLLVFTNVASLE